MNLTPLSLRRLDKKCGSSGIPDNAKCTKATVGSNTTAPSQKAKQNRGPDIINTLRSAYATYGLGAATVEIAKMYQQSGGNAAYAIAGAGTAAGTLLNALGTREHFRGNSGKGFAYNLGGAAASVAGVGGAYAYSNHQEAQRKRRAETGYSGSDPFKDLGIKEGASAEEIRRAYKARARKAHPDLGGSTEEMARVNAAFQEALRRSGGSRTAKRPGRSRPTPSANSPRGRFLSPARGDSVWAWGF